MVVPGRILYWDFDPAVLTQSAEVVRDFIENYHEKSEEEQVFPRFRKAGKMIDFVATLLGQHPAGRHVTDSILKPPPNSRAGGNNRSDPQDRHAIVYYDVPSSCRA